MQTPQIGLALAGGAARGLFHVGATRALAEAGIKIDAWSGTSAGALVGSACASGLTPREVHELAVRVRWTESIVGLKQSARDWMSAIASFWSRDGSAKPGFVETSKLDGYINAAIGHRKFSELPPLIITGCDVHSGEKLLFCSPEVAAKLEAVQMPPCADEDGWRKLYVTRDVAVPHENVGEAVRCSACIPVVMSSVTVDCAGRRRMVNDGGIADMCPVKPLRALGCDKVIAVFLGFLPQVERVGHFLDVGVNAVQFLARDMIRDSLQDADAVLYDPAIERRSLVHLEPDLIEQGYRFTLSQLPRILRALEAPAETVRRPVLETVSK